MRKTQPIATLIAEAALIPSPTVRTLVQKVIAAGVENADDSVFLEGCELSRWEAIAIGSIESVLSEKLDGFFGPIVVNHTGRDTRYSAERNGNLDKACSFWFRDRGVQA